VVRHPWKNIEVSLNVAGYGCALASTLIGGITSKRWATGASASELSDERFLHRLTYLGVFSRLETALLAREFRRYIEASSV